MFRSALIVAVLLTTSPAFALPVGMLGKWTTEKGKCKAEENIVRVEPGKVLRYEDICKVVKEKESNGDFMLSLKCDSEGEVTTGSVAIAPMETNDQLKVAFGGENGFRWLFRCKK